MDGLGLTLSSLFLLSDWELPRQGWGPRVSVPPEIAGMHGSACASDLSSYLILQVS